jgi:hypothetical protein
MPNWSNLSPIQKDFYMEFYAPIINNVRQIPHNNEFIHASRCYPTDHMRNSVIDTGSTLVRTLNYALTEGQRNSVLAFTPTEDAAGIVAYRTAQRARGEQYSEYQGAGDTSEYAIALD